MLTNIRNCIILFIIRNERRGCIMKKLNVLVLNSLKEKNMTAPKDSLLY